MLFYHPSPPLGLDPLLLLLGAMLIDALFGEMPALFRRVPHPVVLVGRAILFLDHRLNRPSRSEEARRTRGTVTTILMIGAALFAGRFIDSWSRSLPLGFLIELFFVAVLLAQRSLFQHVAAVAGGLEHKGLAGGREAVGLIVGRDPKSLDSHGVARAAIESLAENFSDGVVAPVFWYVLFGLPGIFAYKTANTLDSMIGHLTPQHAAFGRTAAKLDDVLNFVPARLSALLIAAAAAFVPKGSPGGALRIARRDAAKHASPNAGWPESAMAGALSLALLGPRRIDGETVLSPWLGDGKAKATPADIRRALQLFIIACLLTGLAVAVLYFLRPGSHSILQGPSNWM